MGISRYELSDVQWEKIKGFLPGRVEHVGRTASDNHLFVNGVLWVLRSGAALVRSAGAVWQVQKRPQAIQPLG